MRWRPEAPSIYLPNSGQIDLNAIGVEAGQANNSQTALNDAAVRGLIGKGANAQNAMSEYYGATNVPPLSGAGATGYFDGTGSKISLGECYPGGWTGDGYPEVITGWKATGSIIGDFASKFESVVIGDIDIYGSSEWMILVYKPGQHSAGSGKSKMVIKQSGRPTTTIDMFDNKGIYENWNSSLSGRLAMFSQQTGQNPEGQMGVSVRKNYVWNHTGYAFSHLNSQGTQNPTTIEFI